MDTWTLWLFSAGSFIIGIAGAAVCVAQGFRMGRQSIDKPMAPIIRPKAKQAVMVDEDPWREPMYGKEQNRSTVEE